MDDAQVMHAMCIDDAYHVEHVLARSARGVTELVTIDGAGPFVRKKIPVPLFRRGVWSALSGSSCARLPHVEATYELPDCVAVVLDYVPGTSLSHYVADRGRLSPDEAVRLTDQICDAVQELHRLGVLHRDLTPSNIVVAADGAHIIDLGISRMLSERPNRNRDTTTLGTYGFAAPEQYGFARTDVRSDVYSIGRLLGYMLTAMYPDDRAYEQLLDDDMVVPPQLRAIVNHASAFEPSTRPQSIEQLRDELGGRRPVPAANGRRGTLRDRLPAGSSSARRPVVVAAIAVVSVVVAVAVALAALTVSGVLPLDAGSPSGDATVQSGGEPAPDTSGGTAGDPVDGTGGTGETDGSGGGTSPVGGDVDTATLIELTETGWSVSDSGYVHYGVGLRNTSDDLRVDFPTIEITGRADDGSVVFSDAQVFNTLFAGETTYCAGRAGNGTAPATVDFSVIAPDRYNVYASRESVSFTVSNTSALPEQYGVASFTGEIEAATDGYEVRDGQQIRLSLILRDERGRIVYGDMSFVDWPSADRPRPFAIDPYGIPDYASYEIYGQIW